MWPVPTFSKMPERRIISAVVGQLHHPRRVMTWPRGGP
jgi:hypothetical protein